MYLVSGCQMELDIFLIASTMSDSKSLNNSLLEVMISSKNEDAFIRDLSNLTLQIIVDSCRASTNVGSMRSIAWNTS